MIRKHTRRAAKAAFAISLGVAIVIGLYAGGVRAAGRVRRADDRPRDEELPRGVHPRRAVQAGARGEGLHGHVQGEHRLDRADPDLAHQRQDQHVSGVHGRDRAGRLPPHALAEDGRGARTSSRRSSRRRRASRCSTPTPFFDTDVLAVTNATAKKYGLKSIGDLKKVGSFKLGGFPECKTRNTCFVGYTKQYGITKATFLPLAGISAYAALDAGTVLAADVFSTDPPLGKGSKYTVLADPKHVTGFQNVAPIVKTSVATALGSKFTTTVNAVSAKLTQNAIVAMNKAVEVDKQSAATVAKAFLKANGLG